VDRETEIFERERRARREAKRVERAARRNVGNVEQGEKVD
jgi:hypothetical protein